MAGPSHVVSPVCWGSVNPILLNLTIPHKGRNILEHLPETQRPWVKAILTRAYTNTNSKAARRRLQDLARRLDSDYPSAAASVREGRDDTLTVLGLGLSERLQLSLATTNAIESLLSRTRHVKRNVKRWRGGTMVLRWVAAGVLEAEKGFRRVKGCKDMPAHVAALRAGDVRGSRGIVRDGRVIVHRAAAEFQQRTGHRCPPQEQLRVIEQPRGSRGERGNEPTAVHDCILFLISSTWLSVESFN